MQYKLIFSDMDQTLVDEGGPFSSFLEETMLKCIDKGSEIVLCSGRPSANLINIAREKRLKGINLRYISGFNGAQIYDVSTDTFVYNNFIAKDEVIRICKQLDELKLDYIIYDQNNVYGTDLSNEYINVEATVLGLPAYTISTYHDSPKILVVAHPDLADGVVLNLQNILTDYHITKSMPFFIEINNQNVNKGAALLQLQNHLNLDNSQVCCFGDSGNDLSMFEVCENAYAVANANDEIKSKAKQIIKDVKEDGVAVFLDELLAKC